MPVARHSAFRLLQHAELQNLHRYPSGRAEAIIQVSSPDDHRAGRVRPTDFIKVIIPANKELPIEFGPLACRSDPSSDIKKSHFVREPLSEKVLNRLKACFKGLETEDKMSLQELLLSRLQPKERLSVVA
jgi:hypothetical protein